jgi:peptide/nickel transport system permease protein
MGTIARRLLQLVVVVLLSTLFAFALLRLFPGDAADAVIPYGTAAQKAKFRADTGLDKPFFEQYATWLANLVQGDLGKDYQSNTPVADKLTAALPVSLQLMLYAQILALVVAVPLGVFTAYRAGTKSDRAVNTGAFALLALPSFVLALALAYWVGVK